MIYAALSGGLGNQMFQYASARHISALLNEELVLDIKWYKNKRNRSVKLQYFNIKARLGLTKGEGIYHIFHDITIPVIRQLKKVLPRVLYNSDYLILQERFEFYNDYVDKVKPGAYLAGLWQSERFFLQSVDLVRKELTLKIDLFSLELIEKSRELKNMNSVMIHVRRGDYLKMPTYKVLGIEYYIQAIHTMINEIGNPFLFIFSDDPFWCNHHLVPVFKSLSVPYQLIDFTITDMEDFLLMSHCRHSIIGNSTFSWWAAWLNDNPGKKVISPAKWFDSGEYTEKDILPSDWIKI